MGLKVLVQQVAFTCIWGGFCPGRISDSEMRSIFDKWRGKEAWMWKKGISGEICLSCNSPWSMFNSRQWRAFIRCGRITFPWLHNYWQIQTGEVMRISGSTELMCLLRLSPSSFAHYATLYLLLSPSPTSPKCPSPSSFFLPVNAPQLLSAFPFDPLLSAACSSISHIITLLPVPRFEILFIFPASVITLSKRLLLSLRNVQLLLFRLFVVCRHDCSTPRNLQDRVGKQLLSRSKRPFCFRRSFPSASLNIRHSCCLFYAVPSTEIQTLALYLVCCFSEATNHFHYKISFFPFCFYWGCTCLPFSSFNDSSALQHLAHPL